MLMLVLVALKILLKSGKQIQREFNIQYVAERFDISGGGRSENLEGQAVIQGLIMEGAFLHIWPQSGGAVAPPATPLPPTL